MILADSINSLDQLGSLGAAGVMGAMWLWERMTSRRREQQIDDAHDRILADRIGIDQLVEVVRANAEAMTRLSATQEQLVRTLEKQ